MGRRFGSWLVAASLGLCEAFTVRCALAEPESRPVQQPLAVVFVRAATATALAAGRGTPADLAGFDAVEGQLRELALLVVAVPAIDDQALASQAFRAAELARQHDAVGTVWFREGDDRQLRVFVYDAKHRQVTSRLLAGADTAAKEEVAVVLRSAILALMAGQATALEQVTLRPAPAAPAVLMPKLQPPKKQRLLAGLAYVATSYAAGTFQHGLQLLAAGEVTSRALLGLQFTWFEQSRLTGAGASAQLQRFPLELFLGYAFVESHQLRVFAENGFQLEVVRRTASITDARLEATPPQSRVRFALAPRLRAAFEAASSLLGFAALGADITTDRYDYVVHSSGGSVRLATRNLRPRLDAGLAVRF